MSERHMGHKLEPRTYLMVLVGLLILTVITVGVAQFDFGVFNNVVAMGVAAVKATLVIMFFMHGKFETKETWAFIIYPIVLLVTLVGFLFIDYGFRPKDANTVAPISFDKQHVSHGNDHATDSHAADASENDHAEDSATHESAEAEVAHEGDASGEHMDTAAEPAADTEVAHAASEESATPATELELKGDAEAGKVTANQLCIACHIIDGKGNALPGAPPFSETMADPVKSTPDYLFKWLKDPQAVKPGTLMPNFNLDDEKIHNLIAFLHALEK